MAEARLDFGVVDSAMGPTARSITDQRGQEESFLGCWECALKTLKKNHVLGNMNQKSPLKRAQSPISRSSQHPCSSWTQLMSATPPDCP